MTLFGVGKDKLNSASSIDTTNLKKACESHDIVKFRKIGNLDIENRNSWRAGSNKERLMKLTIGGTDFYHYGKSYE